MKRGLVFGKFLPLHNGHIALIEFALRHVDPRVEEANQFDLYLYLEPDCEYVQDGTRLSVSERIRLSDHHKNIFNRAGISIVSITGDWDTRYKKAIKIIQQKYFA